MKQKLALSTVAAFYLALAPSTVYAVNSADICRMLFQERDFKPMEAAKRDRSEALKKVEEAAREKAQSKDPNATASVDIKILQNAKLEGIPESQGIVRLAVTWLRGVFEPRFDHETATGAMFLPGGQPIKYGGRPYIEFPNSTMMTTEDARGNTRSWVLTRGVREYKDQINRTTGEISPDGYVSDVLLFEMVGGKPVFHSIYLESAPELGFLFEDPRISVVADGKGGKKYLLSGTDYSDHVGPEHNPKRDKDVMNRYVELTIDRETGVPQKVAVNPITKEPQFFDLSPAPVLIKEPVKNIYGRVVKQAVYRKIDAKNATVSVNDNGEVVVLARLRPDFKGDEEMLRMFDNKPWNYAEQVFIFKNWDEFKAYDRRDLMVDLSGKAGTEKTFGAIRPVVAKELMRDSDLKEHLRVADKDKENLKIVEGDKGMGPGTRPIRLQLVGNLLMVSDGPGLPMYVHDMLSPAELSTFPMKDGEVIYAKLDHEIRKVKQKSWTGWLKRRHYSASVKLLNARMDEVTDYLPDVVQPKSKWELGLNSGILDLLHVYPMGIGIVPAKGASKMKPVSAAVLAQLRSVMSNPSISAQAKIAAVQDVVSTHGLGDVIVTAGISDAHTSVWGVKWKTVIKEARAYTASHR